MAQYAITKLLDGPRNAVFHIAFEGDGSGDITNVVLIDPATSFDPALPASPAMTIERLMYDLTGFDAKLEFDYLTSDTFVWSLTGDQYADVDLCHFGGLKDRSPALDGQGTLKISTRGLGANETGVLVIHVRKS
jgi:hypothetical protein